MKSCGFSHKDNNTDVHVVLYCLKILTNTAESSGLCHFWDFLFNCRALPVRLQNRGRLRSEMWRQGVACTGQLMSFVLVSGHVRFISQVEPLVVQQFHTSSTPPCLVRDLQISHWYPLVLLAPSSFSICTTKRCFIHILTNIKKIYICIKYTEGFAIWFKFCAFFFGFFGGNVETKCS